MDNERLIPLPGRYAVQETYESRAVTITFQDYHEMCDYLKVLGLVRPDYPKDTAAPDLETKVVGKVS